MKKGFLAILLALVVAFGMAMSAADRAEAITLAIPEDGFLVPYVEGDVATGLDTVIGILCIPQSGDPVKTVAWAFFDELSIHVMDDEIPMTPGDVYLFSWNAHKGFGLDGTVGYLVFVNVTDNQTVLSANALRIIGLDVAAFIPVVPLAAGDVLFQGTDISAVASLTYGIQAYDNILIRYAIDGFNSEIVIWITDVDVARTLTVDIYNLEEGATSVEIDLPWELNFIDPAVQVGRPAAYVDGFYHIGSTTDLIEDDCVAFTLVSETSSPPKEIQTLLATHYTVID